MATRNSLPAGLVLIATLLVCFVWNGASGQSCPTDAGKYCTCDYGTVFPNIQTMICSNFGEQPDMPMVFTKHDSIIQNVEVTASSIAKLQGGVFATIHMRSLKLSKIGLRIITPDAFVGGEVGNTLENLNLEDNELDELSSHAFSPLKVLVLLKLNGNKLFEIGKSYFKGLYSLRHLHLSQNRIRQVEAGSLQEMQELRRVYLHQNNLTAITDGVFQNMRNLEEIMVRENQIKSVSPNAFHNVTSLQRIDLSFNNLSSIPEKLFQHTTELSSLHLTMNNITTLDTGFLYSTKKLVYLDLAYNKLTRLTPAAFEKLDQLKALYLESNKLERIPEFAFEYMERLETLHMQNNRIVELPFNNLIGLPLLKELDLHGNRLELLIYGIFDPLGNLQKLDLSRNFIQLVHFGPFDALRKLKSLDLSYNRIRSVSNEWFRHVVELKQLKLNDNAIRNVPHEAFQHMPNLEFLDLSNNRLEQLESFSFLNSSALRELWMSNNPLNGLKKEMFAGLKSLTKLYLNKTCIQELPDSVFESASELQELNLQGNAIHSVHPDSYAGLGKLKMLDMSYNNLTAVSSKPFAALPALKELSLSGNSLDYTVFHEFVPETKAAEIDLTFNDITHIPSNMSGVTLHQNALLLSGNPILCDCDTFWMRSYRYITDFEFLRCSSPNYLTSQPVVCFQPLVSCPPVSFTIYSQYCNTNPTLPADDNSYGLRMSDQGHCAVVPEPTTTAAPVEIMTKTFTMTVTRPPGIEKEDIKLSVDVDMREMTLKWTVTVDVNSNETVPTIWAYFVKHKTFSKNDFNRSSRMPNTTNSYTIKELKPGDRIEVCLEVLYGNDNSTTEVCRKVITKDPDETINRDDSNFFLIIVMSAAVAGVIIFATIIFICCKVCCKDKNAADSENKLKTAMWIDTFNYVGNVDEQMAEQDVVEWDVYRPGGQLPATVRNKPFHRNSLTGTAEKEKANGDVSRPNSGVVENHYVDIADTPAHRYSKRSNGSRPNSMSVAQGYEQLTESVSDGIQSAEDKRSSVTDDYVQPVDVTGEVYVVSGQTMDVADDDLCAW